MLVYSLEGALSEFSIALTIRSHDSHFPAPRLGFCALSGPLSRRNLYPDLLLQV